MSIKLKTYEKVNHENSVKCVECKCKVRSNDTVESHVKTVHETTTKRFKCSKCNRMFSSKNDCEAHIKKEHSQLTKNYTCDKCIRQGMANMNVVQTYRQQAEGQCDATNMEFSNNYTDRLTKSNTCIPTPPVHCSEGNFR